MDESFQTSRLNRTARWVLAGFLVIAAFFLLTEHWAHVMGVLPFLLLLACPLMHLFMHGRHGGHHHSAGQQDSPPAKPGAEVKP